MSARPMLEAVAHGERSASIVAIRDAIADAGCLLDVHAFSNLVMSFDVELDVSRTASFEAALRSSDVVLSDVSVEALAAAARAHRGDAPVRALLSVTFRRGDGELRSEIPRVPG